MDGTTLVIFIGALIFVSHYFTSIFERHGIPDVLLLLLVGVLIGPLLGLVKASDFGIVQGVFTTITLVFILFEGGLDLRFEVLQKSLRGTMMLTVSGFIATVLVVGFSCWLLLDMPPLSAFTLGGILGGTSSAVVIPMVRQLTMGEKSRTILVLESAFTDVLCIVLVIALVQAHATEGLQVMHIVGSILSSFVLASLLGIASALLWSALLGKIRTLKNSMFTTPAYLFVVYGVAENLGFSGAIAALAFGLSLANIERFPVKYIRKIHSRGLDSFNESEKQFFSEMVYLLKTFFFVFIGLSMQLDNFWALLLGLVIAIMIYIVRIPVVRFAVRDALPTMDLTIMATMVPKGLAAAVLAGVPLQVGMQQGDMIRDLTYAVVLISIVLTSILMPIIKHYPRAAALWGLLLRRHTSSKTALQPAQSVLPAEENMGGETPEKVATTATNEGQAESLTSISSSQEQGA
jgi:sodium/hydrogen exchanger